MDARSQLEPMFSLLALLPPQVRVSMIAMYGESLVSQIALLRQATEAGDAQAMQEVVHKLAGAAAMMQDRELSLVARAMETGLRESRAEAALQAWPQVQACARVTLEALRLAGSPAG